MVEPWGSFDRRRRENPVGGEKPEAAEYSSFSNDLAIQCSHALGGPAGQKLLEMLRKRDVDRRFAATIPESALRVFDARRQFVLELEGMTSKGRELLNERRAKPKPDA